MNKAIARVFELLHQLRDTRSEYVISVSDSLDGFIQGLFWAGVITDDQYKALAVLAGNAFCNSGKPFPTLLNAGPCISWWELHKRTVATHLLEKPQAVPGNEPVQLQPVAACPGLHLLCLLVEGRNGQALALPVHTLRPMPPRVCGADPHPENGPRRWCLETAPLEMVDHPGLYLRETHSTRPTAEVLERCSGHRQARALRPALGSVRVGGLS